MWITSKMTHLLPYCHSLNIYNNFIFCISSNTNSVEMNTILFLNNLHQHGTWTYMLNNSLKSSLS